MLLGGGAGQPDREDLLLLRGQVLLEQGPDAVDARDVAVQLGEGKVELEVLILQ